MDKATSPHLFSTVDWRQVGLLFLAKLSESSIDRGCTHQRRYRHHWPMGLLCHSCIFLIVHTSGRSRELLDQYHTIPDAV